MNFSKISVWGESHKLRARDPTFIVLHAGKNRRRGKEVVVSFGRVQAVAEHQHEIKHLEQVVAVMKAQMDAGTGLPSEGSLAEF